MGVYPKVDIQRAPADDFVAAPTSLLFESLIDVNVATILRTGYADGKRTLSKRFGEFFLRSYKLCLGFSSPGSLPEESKNGRGLHQYKKNGGEDVLLI